MEEASPLIVKPSGGDEAVTPETKLQAAAMHESPEREWDGHLLNMCGSFDQHGVSTFAYVKMLAPLAWMHNVQRAFGKGYWKQKRYEHLLVFAILAFFWSGLLYQGAFTPRCHAPRPLPERPDAFHPKLDGDQEILNGAILDPEISKQLPGGDLDWVDVEDAEASDEGVAIEAAAITTLSTEDTETDVQQIQNQIQSAKLQAAEGMAMLGAGRKLLHKHKHDQDHDKGHDHKKKGWHKHHDDDDDDDDDDDHKDKHAHKGQHDRDEKSERDLPKSMGPWDEMHNGRFEDAGFPRCDPLDYSGIGFLTFITALIFIIYAIDMRTAIRNRFGITGSWYRDCLAWFFCGPCALCQESRTLARNNVYEGEWYGETVLTQSTGFTLQAPQAVTTAATKPV